MSKYVIKEKILLLLYNKLKRLLIIHKSNILLLHFYLEFYFKIVIISNSNFSYRLIFPSQISLFLIHIYIIPQKQLITAKIYCFLLINVKDLFLIYLIFNPNNFDNSNA